MASVRGFRLSWGPFVWRDSLGRNWELQVRSDPAFVRTFKVWYADEEAVRVLFDSPLRAALLTLVGGWPLYRIDGTARRLALSMEAEPLDAEAFDNLLEAGVRVRQSFVEALRRSSGDVGGSGAELRSDHHGP